MACNDDFRHVCYKDLENYIKRDDYFSDFTDEEIKLIQKNLGINQDIDNDISFEPTIVVGSYTEIYDLKVNGLLKIGYVYMINNFRSIYLDKEGNTLGLDKLPSQEYYLLLTPTSTSTFSPRVSLKSKDSNQSYSLKWIVDYDITPVEYPDGTQSRGKITYLKDQNNNYAYYDFKNIKFLLTLEELNKGPKTYEQSDYFYTFDIDGKDASLDICKNNHLEAGAYRNVFFGNTQNVSLTADCHDNVFFKTCEACQFKYGTHNNYFTENVLYCYGSLNNKELGSLTALNTPKDFIILSNKQVVRYLDPETLTTQIQEV